MVETKKEGAPIEPAPPEAEAHHVRLTRLANAASMLSLRLSDLTPEEREMVDDRVEDQEPFGPLDCDALDAILGALGAGD